MVQLFTPPRLIGVHHKSQPPHPFKEMAIASKYGQSKCRLSSYVELPHDGLVMVLGYIDKWIRRDRLVEILIISDDSNTVFIAERN